jgi:hypothetical protein
LRLFFRPPAFFAQERRKLGLFRIFAHRICALLACGRGLDRLPEGEEDALAFDHLGLFDIHSFLPIKLYVYHTSPR